MHGNKNKFLQLATAQLNYVIISKVESTDPTRRISIIYHYTTVLLKQYHVIANEEIRLYV